MTDKTRKIQCDGVIFDVDGTLWDSTPVVVNAFNEIVSREKDLPYHFTVEDLRNNFGKPIKEIGKTLMKEVPDERNWAIMQKMMKREDEVLRENPPKSYPGVKQVFASLFSTYPLFIVSNCQAGYIELFLSATETGSYITAHCCPDDTGLLKAGNIRRIAESYHLKQPVYVGDTAMDEAACQEAGVPMIYAAYGFGRAEHPAAVIQQPTDLLKIL